MAEIGERGRVEIDDLGDEGYVSRGWSGHWLGDKDGERHAEEKVWLERRCRAGGCRRGLGGRVATVVEHLWTWTIKSVLIEGSV